VVLFNTLTFFFPFSFAVLRPLRSVGVSTDYTLLLHGLKAAECFFSDRVDAILGARVCIEGDRAYLQGKHTHTRGGRRGYVLQAHDTFPVLRMLRLLDFLDHLLGLPNIVF